MDYIEADDQLFAVIQDVGTPMFGTIASTPFRHTYRAMFGFCVKTNALKTAMFDMIESNNPYGFKALFRCYCDHYPKFTYIFARFMKEHTDDVGREYYSYCGAVESRDHLKAITTAESLVGDTVVRDIRMAINAVYPELSALSLSDLERGAEKFRYRAILRFLSSDVPAFVGPNNVFLSRIVPTFAELSSFVHGGPTSEIDMRTYATPQALERCRDDAGLVFMMCGSVFMFTAMAVSRDYPEHARAASLAKEILDRYADGADRSLPSDA